MFLYTDFDLIVIIQKDKCTDDIIVNYVLKFEKLNILQYLSSSMSTFK